MALSLVQIQWYSTKWQGYSKQRLASFTACQFFLVIEPQIVETLRQVVVVIVDRVIVRYHRVLNIGIQDMSDTLGQYIHCIREFYGYVMTMERLVIGLRSILGMSWSFNQGQNMFLTRLKLQWFVMTIRRLVIISETSSEWNYQATSSTRSMSQAYGIFD